MQRIGETIDQYVTELRHRSKTCKLGELTDSLIIDRIVWGIPDNRLRERLLREQDLDLEKVLLLCRAAETVKTQAKELLNETCTVDVARKCQTPLSESVKKPMFSESGRGTDEKRQQTCDRCGMQHLPRKCPAYGKNCNHCDKNNNYAHCCKSKRSFNQVNAITECEVEEFYVDAVTDCESNQKYMESTSAN